MPEVWLYFFVLGQVFLMGPDVQFGSVSSDKGLDLSRLDGQGSLFVSP